MVFVDVVLMNGEIQYETDARRADVNKREISSKLKWINKDFDNIYKWRERDINVKKKFYSMKVEDTGDFSGVMEHTANTS